MRYQIEGFEVEVVYKKIKGIYLRVDPEDGTVRLHVPNGTTQEQIAQVVHDHRTWIASRKKRPSATEVQKEAMRERLKSLIPYWEQTMGLRASRYTLRSMRSRWGSCNPKTGHITLNLELAALTEECLSYVLVHELSHLLYPGHDRDFWSHVERYVPEWKRIRRYMRKGE